VGTAVLGTIFIGLIGFYVIPNALRRDVLSRCGYVIAYAGIALAFLAAAHLYHRFDLRRNW
jgi:hypothetical protein